GGVASVPPDLGDGAASAGRPRARWLPDPGWVTGPIQPVRGEPRSAVVSGLAAVRPRALHAGGRGLTPQVVVLPVRRRSTRLHRRALRQDGVDDRPGVDRPGLRTRAGARSPHRLLRVDLDPAEVRDPDDGAAAGAGREL